MNSTWGNNINEILKRRSIGCWIRPNECTELRRHAKRLIKEQLGETVHMKNMMIIPYSKYYIVVNLDKEFFKPETPAYHYNITATTAEKIIEGGLI